MRFDGVADEAWRQELLEMHVEASSDEELSKVDLALKARKGPEDID